MNITPKCLLAGCLSLLTSQYAWSTYDATQVHLKLVKPIILSNTHMLDFGTIVGGRTENIAISPQDPGAAVFRATGEPGLAVAASITESKITLKDHRGDKIQVGNFNFGGDLKKAQKARFNNHGELDDLRVGATAYIQDNDAAGDYYGTATFQLVYIGK